jgi:hypothetical protein
LAPNAPAGPYATGKIGTAGDSPHSSLTDHDAAKFVDGEKYRTYIMFKPSGAESNWVPLQFYGWNWNGDASRPNEVDWVLNSAGEHLDKTPTSTSSHPHWSAIFANGKWAGN